MQPIINSFTQFQLTDKEQLAGQILTSAQLAVLQNLRAEYALKKINLNYTPNDHQAWVQQEAEISGWMGCLDYIMELHNSAIEIVANTNNPDDSQSSGDSVTIFHG